MTLPLRNAIVAIFRFFGSDVIDQRTGRRVGRAFVFGWSGRVIVIGLDSEPPLRPIFLPQKRLTLWKQEIGFTSHPEPDFPSSPPPEPPNPETESTAEPSREGALRQAQGLELAESPELVEVVETAGGGPEKGRANPNKRP
jgi:hypothetical protein